MFNTSTAMLDRKHIIGAIAAFIGVVVFGTLVLAWPSYRQVRAIHRDIADLRGRIEMLDASTAEVARLESELVEAQRRVREDLKIIGDSPEFADLMRRFSLPVDHTTVIDQTFTAGSPVPIPIDDPSSLSGSSRGPAPSPPERPMAMPVTIELVGTFESLFAILSAAESMDRLVRVSTLRVSCDRTEKNDARREPVLNASVGLEAVYAERAGFRR